MVACSKRCRTAIELPMCRLMQLPQVEADELGHPIWNVTSGEVSRAYRKISVLVHPDKNPGEDAQQAFEALNQAHRKLRDRGELVSSVILKNNCSMCSQSCICSCFSDSSLRACILSIQSASVLSWKTLPIALPTSTGLSDSCVMSNSTEKSYKTGPLLQLGYH